MTTADKVRALIHESGLSQKAYAQSVGIHHITLCNCLKDDNLSMKSLRKIADKEGISISSLLPDSAPKEEKAPVTSINGYIEYDGIIEAIRSIEDLERVWSRVSGKTNPVSQSPKKAEKPASKPREQKQAEEKPKYKIKCSDEGYAYFYMDVPLSNWWDSVPAIEYDGHTFNSSEAIFMYLKAKHFNDEETAAKIVKADNKTYAQPKSRWDAVKRLGGKVKNYEDKKWAGPNRKAMAIALKQKALYDKEFKRVLLDPQYAGMTFVEASKHDNIWGIGIDMRAAMRAGKAGWQGHNFLGRALTELRNELRPDLAESPKIG